MRLRVQLNFVVDFDDGLTDMTTDLNDAFEGAIRGLYPRAQSAMIEPNGRVNVTRLPKLKRVKESEPEDDIEEEPR